MKRKTIDHILCSVEYISCGNDIFVLDYRFKYNDSEDEEYLLEAILKSSLGEDITIHLVEPTKII